MEYIDEEGGTISLLWLTWVSACRDQLCLYQSKCEGTSRTEENDFGSHLNAEVLSSLCRLGKPLGRKNDGVRKWRWKVGEGRYIASPRSALNCILWESLYDPTPFGWVFSICNAEMVFLFPVLSVRVSELEMILYLLLLLYLLVSWLVSLGITVCLNFYDSNANW